MSKESRIVELILKKQQTGLTASEGQELDAFCNESEANRAFVARYDDESYLTKRFAEIEAIDPRAGWAKFREEYQQKRSPLSFIRGNWFRVAAAASVLLLLSAAAFLWINNRHKPAAQQGTLATVQDLAPGSQKAILILADNTTIDLDSAGSGTIARQGASHVVKTDKGAISYLRDEANGNSQTVSYNQLVTPRGAQYKLVLPDGSTVWLNAASSIKYPTSFTGNERRVEMTGEAYFEIAKQTAPGGKGRIPFIVEVDGTQVEVLGTHFNVNAYSDEPVIKTTLLEGIVKVVKGGNSALLKPGQQAQVKGTSINTIAADTDLEMAWVNGLFQFKKANVKSIMRQVSRWYNVEIEYSGDPTSTFSGTIPRSVNASKLFALLEATGNVHFKIADNKVTVLP